MREILFKAKRLDNGECVEGMLIKTHIGLFICFEENSHYCSQYGYMKIDGIAMVDGNTLCQYTGLTDKNGKKIFEGDIVRYDENYGEVKFGLYESDWQIDKYNQGFFVTFPKEYLFRRELGFWRNKIVVVGNIFDNADLLEVE